MSSLLFRHHEEHLRKFPDSVVECPEIVPYRSSIRLCGEYPFLAASYRVAGTCIQPKVTAVLCHLCRHRRRNPNHRRESVILNESQKMQERRPTCNSDSRSAVCNQVAGILDSRFNRPLLRVPGSRVSPLVAGFMSPAKPRGVHPR